MNTNAVIVRQVNGRLDGVIAPNPDLGRSFVGPLRDWVAICDFDGTIAESDVTDVLLERFALPEWRLIESRWRSGLITSLECLRKQVELLLASKAELSAVLRDIQLDPGFAAFVAQAHAAGCAVHIASEGFDQLIRAMLARLPNLPSLPLAATYLIPAGVNSWTLGFPYARSDCISCAATCKCAVAAAAPYATRRVMLIGDGLSDRCLARRADCVFARGRLLDICREERIPHCPAPDFTSVLAHLAPHLQAASDGAHG